MLIDICDTELSHIYRERLCRECCLRFNLHHNRHRDQYFLNNAIYMVNLNHMMVDFFNAAFQDLYF